MGSDETTMRADSAVQRLDPITLPLAGSRLIEASAGTGKTFTIAMLYVRAILGHGDVPHCGRPLTPRDILVVTFTDAATKELRDRIRKRLAEAAEVFRQPPDHLGDGGPLYQLRQQFPDPEHWPSRARLLELAAESMDEASVHTIHGWCNRMLKEHAFDSGGLFNQTLETDQSELLAMAVKDYWRTFVASLDEGVANLWLEVIASPQTLQTELLRLLAMADQVPAPTGTPAQLLENRVGCLRETFNRVRPTLATDADEFLQLLKEAGQRKDFNGNKLRLKHAESWLATLKDWAALDDLSAPELSPAAWARLSPEGLEDAWKSGNVPTDHELIRKVVLLRECCGEPLPTQQILFHACHWVAERLEREKLRRAEMGFDDLLHRLDGALRSDAGPRLARAIRKQFPLAMIDEFQDTDPVQYRIFDAVYQVQLNTPETGLLMIGDPKQAIYAFRGADIFTYLQARSATTGRHVTLPRNFRSASTMVAAANQVFLYAEERSAYGAFLFRNGSDNAVPFLPVEAQGRPESLQIGGEPVEALTFWVRESSDTKGNAMADVAAACASEVARLLNQGQEGQTGFRDENGHWLSLKASDLAILVNNGTEANLIRTALSARGVKSVYLSDRASVLETPQARDVIYWLEACAEPERDGLVRVALATGTLGMDWRSLDQLRNNELAWEAELEHFRNFRHIWRDQGVLAMIRQLLNHFDIPARLLARPDGERVLTDVLHIAELLQQESLQVDGEQSLIRRFVDMVSGAENRADALQVRLESDAELVQVITVHKSKGLEYPLVFLPFATSCRPAQANRLPVAWHDESGERRLAFEASEELTAKVDRERLGEDIRKLYVALTRARHATWVGAPALKGEEARSALGYLAGLEPDGSIAACLEGLAVGCSEIAVRALQSVSDESYCPRQSMGLGPARSPTARTWDSWWISSYSAIRYRNDGGELGAPEQKAESETAGAERFLEESDVAAVTAPPPLRTPPSDTSDIHRFYRGAGPGTFLHALLEWAAEEGFDQVMQDQDKRLIHVEKRCQARGWDGWAVPLNRWLGDMLAADLPLPRQPSGDPATVALAAMAQVVPEMEFWIASQRVDTSELDRLVRQQTMTRWNLRDIPHRPVADSMMLNGMLKGFIDLVFEHEGRYYVADYKSNYLGPGDEYYTEPAMARVVAEKRYDLQFSLYVLALHRLLKSRLPDYDYDRHVGGAVYLFLRGSRSLGSGTYCERPGRELIEAMDRLFRTGCAGQDGVMEQEALI